MNFCHSIDQQVHFKHIILDTMQFPFLRLFVTNILQMFLIINIGAVFTVCQFFLRKLFKHFLLGSIFATFLKVLVLSDHHDTPRGFYFGILIIYRKQNFLKKYYDIIMEILAFVSKYLIHSLNID